MILGERPAAGRRPLDSVLAYRFDAVAGRLEASGWYEGELHVGCRHLVFAAGGRFAYGINQGRLRGALNPCARKLSDFTIGFPKEM